MEDDDQRNNNDGNEEDPPERWTCEACGCNTNAAADRACSICGTASGPSILRRAGYAARAGLFARGAGGNRRDFLGDQGGDIADLWGRVVDGAGLSGDDQEAMAALAMEVAAGHPTGGRSRESTRQRLLDAARNFGLANREGAAPTNSHLELMQAASDNASSFRPKWASPPQIDGRVNTENIIQIGDGEQQNIAHLPVGGGEGRALRALETVPRNIPFSALVSSGRNQERRHRRTFGFRVAFDHPDHEAGSNLGGCYLVGVTTSSFSNFGERNGLQQSPLFWGVEDGGNKFEGSRYSSQTARGSRVENYNYCAELAPDEAPLNGHGVLFGAREMVTVVVDIDSRTMSFWRDDQYLGILVTNLPRGGSLYPIAVPFDVGSTVAITGMDGNPLTLLRNFNSGWKEAQQKNDEEKRKLLASHRSVLIKGVELSTQLAKVLRSIFSWYFTSRSTKAEGLQLNRVEAARLWYRCGIKLENLDSLFEADENKTGVCIDDFLSVLSRVAGEDAQRSEQQIKSYGERIQVGDRVQLVEGYEGKGDATAGPLQPGDRGRVVEVQRGPTGQWHSVRVLQGGRRWWYQPQAVVSERCGLIESSAVWWLHQILRAHGFEHTTLKSFVGKPVTSTSWEFGDIVVPSKISTEMADESSSSMPMQSVVGRIVPSASRYKRSSPTSTTEPVLKDSDFILVEFVDARFEKLVGLPPSADSDADGTSGLLQTRRVKVSELVHSTVFHGVEVFQKAGSGLEIPFGQGECHTDPNHVVPFSLSPEDIVSDSTKKNIASIIKLDVRAIEAITKECKSNPGSLASLFAVGLPGAIISAIESTMEKTITTGPKESISQLVETLGALSVCVCNHLFGQGGISHDDNECCVNIDMNSKNGDDAMEEASIESQQNNHLGNIAAAAIGGHGLEDPSQIGRLSSLQQRRSVLLALMSRARRGNDGSLNDPAGPEDDDLGIRQVMQGMPLGHSAATHPFLPGAGVELFDDGLDDFFGLSGVGAGNARAREGLTGPFAGEPGAPPALGGSSADEEIDVFLWSIVRGSSAGPSTKRASRDNSGISVPALLRSLGLSGLLTNSLPWVEALLQIQNKGKPTSGGQSLVLQAASDEDEIPILQVAISLGCSALILKCLIRNGAHVGENEIRKAAYTNQPAALTILLQHATHLHGSFDLKKCTPAIADVVKRVGIFQLELKQKMTAESGDFASKCLRRFIQFGLLCRSHRHESTYWTACSETTTGTLSGYAMLRALQTQQATAESAAANVNVDVNVDADDDEDKNTDSDEYQQSSPPLSQHGLMSIVPVEVLGKVFLSGETCDLTNLLLLVEDFLYSKAVGDGAVGLTLLLALLEKFPFLSTSAEMHRYGFNELVASHSAMASRRLDDVTGNELPRRANAALDPAAGTSANFDGSVRCPAKHVATLHITRHSSFRCDLCGKGVDRGRPMHGCRECDWDACFECTDHKTAFAKNTHVKKLSERCRERLCSTASPSNGAVGEISVVQSLQKLSDLDNSAGLRSLSICLQQGDVTATQELARMLEMPGLITNHQFCFSILPSLHASLLGKGSERSEQSNYFCGGSGHRNKKARVVDECGKGALDIARYLLHGIPSASVETNGEVMMDETEPIDDSSKSSNQILENKKKLPEIVRRLHCVLSFNETLSSVPSASKGDGVDGSKGALKSLTQPIDIQLWPSNESQPNSMCPLVTPMAIATEPLVSIEDIELQVLRTVKCNHPSYVAFCQRLANEGAIIVEQARTGRGKEWRLGRISSYDDTLGFHGINYAESWIGQGSINDAILEVINADNDAFNSIKFERAGTRLVLAAREYYICLGGSRDEPSDPSASAVSDSERLLSSSDVDSDGLNDRHSSGDLPSIGKRVELRNASCGAQKGSYTILALDAHTSQCVLVSDLGLVSTHASSQIAQPSGPPRSLSERRRSNRRQERDRDPFSRGFPFLSARNHLSELSRRDSEREGKSNQLGVLKRSWSALSLMESMQPIELSSRDEPEHRLDKFVPGRGLMLRCTQGVIVIDQASIQVPPLLRVEFSTRDTLATFDMSSKRSLPLIGALKQLKQMAEPRCGQENSRGAQNLYYAIKTDARPSDLGETCSPLVSSNWRARSANKLANSDEIVARADAALAASGLLSEMNPATWAVQSSRSRKVRASSISEEGQKLGGLCNGLSDICVQCMEVLGHLCVMYGSDELDAESAPKLFENLGLSTKLAMELDDPLTVVGGALPDWCIIAPIFAPRLFSYDSRRLLLERSAFGVSRSTLKQQEAKVNVGRLRERMASLRGRAVELVGEAFSGGASDPTSLQLQADELYGMEESLANRVKAAFRAHNWDEHALEVAKAAVERESLLSDAEKIFEKICQADRVCGRRLEVRFENESGFDAAAGSQAGVTRGFFADVAEALLSCDNVSGVQCVQICPPNKPKDVEEDGKPFVKTSVLQASCKLPMFIPDTDSQSQVIIPTPRSDPRSSLGVFPRPISTHHPQFHDVMARYKFMGRLFAAAMRDSLMFPLPLSSSFLKLVQQCAAVEPNDGRGLPDENVILTALELPRAGFLGGEIYAADLHICRTLDDIDASETPLTPQQINNRCTEIATDKSFARIALGKSYDCSFEEYFQDRTFVDPLDPSQGPGATPLCPNGHEMQVTIHNIRDYVALSKKFMLHDGVICQAQAFRAGVDDFFSSEYLRLFTPEELQRDVCGSGDNVDNWKEADIRKLLKLDGGKGAAEALVAVAAIGGEGGTALSRRFGSSSPTIGHLIKALVEGSPKRRRQFLSFCTSVPIVTPGEIEVVPIMSPGGEFQPMSDPSCLPRANTCARRLYLPKFENYESFVQLLWAVVEEESRFKGFYEWRGS